MTTSKLRFRIAGILALAGGFLIVASGFAVHGFLLFVLNFLNGKIPYYLPGFTGEFASFTIQVLTITIALGGITVILGGIAVLFGHLFTGRLLIALGGGAGFLGLAITIAYSALTLGPSTIITHSEYWIGVILAVIARSLAKRK